MVVSLMKSFDIDKELNEYTRQKKLALCMWYKIIVALQHENYVDVQREKFIFTFEHNLKWRNYCFLCHLFMKSNKYTGASCIECPLSSKKYRGGKIYGCASDCHKTSVTPWERVIDEWLSKEERIAAAWEIVEAIKSI